MLNGIKVVEFAEGVAGPLAALRLGDLGAAVVKIETREGDFMREAEPSMADGMSAAFYALNRGKRSFMLDVKDSCSVDTILSLLTDADVFITDRSDADLCDIGLQDVLAPGWPRNPRLIVVDVSAWGANGPMAGTPGSEVTVQAMAGYTRYLGARNEAPRRLGADVAGAAAAAFVAQAALAALYARSRSADGHGQRVRTSMLNALISMKSIHLAAQSDPDQYAGPRVGGAYYPPERGWKTADRPVFFAFGGSVGAEGRPGWEHFVTEIGMSHLLSDARLDRNGRNSTGHGPLVPEMRETYEAGFAGFTADDLVNRIRKLGANAAVYMRADETLDHAQTAGLDFVKESAGPNPHRLLGYPARFDGRDLQQGDRAPGLGEHTRGLTDDFKRRARKTSRRENNILNNK